MRKFYLTLDLDVTVDVEIEAESFEEAREKAETREYELPSLNDSNIGEEHLVMLRAKDSDEVEMLD